METEAPVAPAVAPAGAAARAARLRAHQELWLATTAAGVAGFFLLYNTANLWRRALTPVTALRMPPAAIAGVAGALGAATAVGVTISRGRAALV